MNFIVIGCGRVGSELAYRLFLKGHKVTVIDQNEKAFLNLPSDFSGRTLEGEALNLDILKRAGVNDASGVAVVTNLDTLNAVIGHTIRTAFNASNIVVRNYDPKWRPMFEAFGLQSVSSTSWGAQRIEEMLYHAEMRAVFSAGNGEVELYEFRVPNSWQGQTLSDLFTHPEATCVAITRAGRAVLPNDSSLLETDDILLVSATFDGIEAVRAQLKRKEQE